MIQFGTRIGGAVEHVITHGMISACGRYMVHAHTVAGSTGKRMCLGCVSVNADARKAYDTARKRTRDAAIMATMGEATTEVESWSYDLTEEELTATLDKINKLNARCANKGIPGGLTVEYNHIQREYEGIGGLKLTKWVYETKITGIAPQIPGWRFLATLDYDRNAGLITRMYPYAVGTVDRTVLREGWCDHCQTTRYRKRTYVVQSTTTGEQIQVGSACIKDFTGWTALPVSFGPKVESWGAGFGGGPQDFTTETVLGVAWACVQAYGFKRSNEIGSTKGMMFNVLYPPTRIDPEFKRELDSLRQFADVAMGEKAAELRAWILSDEFRGESEYVYNLKAVCRGEKVSSSNFGLIASAPQSWARSMERTLVRKQESGPVSEWQGEKGKPITLTATIEAIRYIDGDWGVTTLYKLRDASGNLFEWFASNDKLGDREGVTWTFTATVKDHKEWKGYKTTAINRVRKEKRVQS